MSRVKINKQRKPLKPGKQVTLYFNKEVPRELFQVVNANLKNTNAFMLEVLSVVFESAEIYKEVKEHMSRIPSGRIYAFPDIRKQSNEENESKTTLHDESNVSDIVKGTQDMMDSIIQDNKHTGVTTNVKDTPDTVEKIASTSSKEETKNLQRQSNEDKKNKAITWKK